MGTLDFAGDGKQDASMNVPNVEIPKAGSRSGSGNIDFAGNGGQDTGGASDAKPVPNKGIIDTSMGKGKIEFSGDV